MREREGGSEKREEKGYGTDLEGIKKKRGKG